jgi:hypothetical protein
MAVCTGGSCSETSMQRISRNVQRMRSATATRLPGLSRKVA